MTVVYLLVQHGLSQGKDPVYTPAPNDCGISVDATWSVTR